MTGEETGHKVTDSQVIMHEIVLPNETNILGNVLGGHVMHLMDLCAAMAAMKHCRKVVVTAAVDNVNFLHPVKKGEVMILKSSVNYADRTSMEVGVRIMAEDPLIGDQRHTSSAYLTFVALDEEGKPTSVPAVIPISDEDKRRFREGKARREERLMRLKSKG